MSKLRLSLAALPYDRLLALMTGEVAIEGVELTCVPLRSPVELFSRMIANYEFDIAEMSLTHCYVLQQRGEARFVALPIFPSRMFRHGFIFVNEQAGIRSPKDIEGRRIGLQGYQAAATVWARGVLRHEYGVSFDTVEWFEGFANRKGLADRGPTHLRPDREFSAAWIGETCTLGNMLAAGEIDALIGPEVPLSLRSSGNVRRLFPDHHRIERDYYRKTGIFPIMHAVVMKEELYRRHPWLATNLYRGFQASKRLAQRLAHTTNALSYMLPWFHEQLDEFDEIFGPDPWPDGLVTNRAALEAYAQFLHEEHFLRVLPRTEDMFVPIEEAKAR